MTATPPPIARDNIWLAELQAILQGAAGGFLFGIPLLYTVEVWSIGSATEPPWLLTVLMVKMETVAAVMKETGEATHELTVTQSVNIHSSSCMQHQPCCLCSCEGA